MHTSRHLAYYSTASVHQWLSLPFVEKYVDPNTAYGSVYLKKCFAFPDCGTKWTCLDMWLNKSYNVRWVNLQDRHFKIKYNWVASCNQFWSRISIHAAYSEVVQCSWAILPSVGCPDLQYFSNFIPRTARF